MCRLQLPGVGLQQPVASTGQGAAFQRQQSLAALLCSGVIGLHQKNRTTPGVGLRQLRVLAQGAGKVIQGGVKLVPVLPQLATHQQQISRHDARKGGDDGLGVANVARVPFGHGLVKVGLR